MRSRRLILVCLLLITTLSLGAVQREPVAFATSASQGGDTNSSVRMQSSSPVHLTGSVVVRDTTGVTLASVDLATYAAGRYIVIYTSAVTDVVATTDELANTYGFEPALIYTSSIHGFAARLDERQLATLRQRSEIAFVESDDVVPAPRAYGMPSGVERVGTLANSTARVNGVDQRVNVDVAVIDSGVDFDNPDLNIAGWADCTSEFGTGWDEIGHGTHVAGTIGALDDGAGVTGVAPGARIWSIKIFVPEGGLESWAICGLEVAAGNGSIIDVANLSWGWYESGADGPCSETTFHQAICDAYNAGITLVNAAGNEDQDAFNSVPTTFSQVIAVSAIADSDGKIGGKGASTDYGCDDCFASFSNYGADIDLAAPGVDILSLCPSYLDCNAGDGLAIESGTSMSAPHVAGAAALYIARNGRVGPSAVRSALIANSDPASLSGDPDGIHERVLYAGDLNPSCSVDPTAGVPGSAAQLTCTGFRATETITVYWDVSGGTRIGTLTATARGNAKGNVAIPNTPRGVHNIIAKGKTSRRSATVSFRIQGTMTLDPTSGDSGSAVTISLAGFAGGESVTVRFDPGRASEETLKTGVMTLSSGTKTFMVTIPLTATVGSHKIEAKGNKGSKVTRTFVVTAGAASVSGAEASPESESTATATMEPTATATGSPAVEPTATGSPTTEATATPAETPAIEPSPEVTATQEPVASPPQESPHATPGGESAG